MKPIHLNLASRPYRDYKPLWAVAIAMAVVTALLLFVNVQTALRYMHATEETRASIDDVEKQTASENARAAEMKNALDRVDLRQTIAQTEFINLQIAERVFSWSRLLDDLEKVLPNDVRIVSLAPKIDQRGGIALQIAAEAKDSQGLITLLDNLLADPRFVNPFPMGESSMSEGGWGFGIQVGYRPELAGEVVR